MTKFNKRHYQAIAEVMQQAYKANGVALNRTNTVAMVADMLGDMFARDNGSFKRDLFIAATKPGANVRARTVEGAQNGRGS